jgi:hypothetical protein
MMGASAAEDDMGTWLKHKRVWIPAGLALAVALYAALGFWWAPKLVRDAIERDGSAALGVPVAVGEVITHPFTLEMTVLDLRVGEPGEPLLALERLYVDLELASLWQRAWVFKVVRLNGPFARAIVRPDGSLNLADLVPEPAADEVDEPLPAVWIQRLLVARGQVNFADHSRRQQPEKVLAPITFDLADFRTTPEGGGFTLAAASETGESFEWRGQLSLQPVASEGSFGIRGLKARGVWEFLSEQLPFELAAGELDLAGEYRFALEPEMQLEATLPRITGRGLALRESGAESDLVQLPSVEVEGSRLSWAAGTLDVAAVTVSGAQVQAWQEADGSLNLERLLAGTPDDAAAAQATDAANADTAASDWQFRLARFSALDASVDFQDRTVSPAVDFDIGALALTATEVSLDSTRELPVTVQATIDDTATFRAEGWLVPESGRAEFEIALAGMALPKLQPYLANLAAVELLDGRLSAEGLATLAAPDEAPWLRFKGESSVQSLRVADREQKEVLVSWEQLDLAGLELEMAPDRLQVQRAVVRKPFLRAVIAPDQSINLVRALSAEPAPGPPAPPTPVRVDEIRLQSATVSFSDFFIEPNFEARIESLDGSIRGLSSAPGARARVDLAGHVVNRFSPVTIEGQLNPFRYDEDTELKLAFRNIDLPVFNPYSGRYAGFAIAKGKLTTELDYRIRERELVAGHRIVLDQLEWGEETDSQEKVSLPIRLATSLLKDRDGVIDLDLPVTGTLDDPTFRVGPVVWQIVRNLVVKIVTAPFSFLGSLFEGAEEAQFVVFAPGEAALTPEQQQSLVALAQGLAERPQLRIAVPAGVVPELDAEAITERRLSAALAALAKVPETEPFALDSLEADEQVDLLRDLYRQQFGQRPKIPDAPEPPESADRGERRSLRDAHDSAWLAAELRPRFAPDDAEVAALASARAAAIQDALLGSGGMDPARVFVGSVTPLAAREGRVSIELALE